MQVVFNDTNSFKNCTCQLSYPVLIEFAVVKMIKYLPTLTALQVTTKKKKKSKKAKE